MKLSILLFASVTMASPLLDVEVIIKQDELRRVGGT